MPSWEGKTRGGVMGYRIFVWTLRNLGLSFAYFLLSFVVVYFLLTSPRAVRATFNFYRRIIGYNRFRSWISTYKNYHLFGQILLDKVALLAGFQQKFTFDFDGEEHLKSMENGGLLVSAHVGNWEIAGNMLNRLGKRIHILLFDAEHEKIKGYLTDVIGTRHVNFIVIRDDFSHLIQLKEAFARKEIVAMHGDRFIEGNKTVTINFMDREARFPVGPANLAARFGVPVSWVFAVKERKYHYHFYASPTLHVPFTTNLAKREESLKGAVKDYALNFEEILRLYPLQWFNYYDFWNISDGSKSGNTNTETA